MKQLTNEIRLQIFQQNINARVKIKKSAVDGVITVIHSGYCEVLRDGSNCDITLDVKDLTLLKRPLYWIKDGEVIEMFKYMGLNGEILGRDKDCVHFITDDNTCIYLWFDGEIIPDESIQGNGWPVYLSAYQYLHMQGFALPYLDWSVEELIKENVYLYNI